MNSTEAEMLSVLAEGVCSHAFVAVKAEFEAEGARLRELIKLVDLARRAGVKVAIKVGGCEAVRDLDDCRQFGADYVIAPMIESPFALAKYAAARDKAYPGDEQRDVSFLFNVETINAKRQLAPLTQIARNAGFGIVFGRVDFAGSLGWGRPAIEGGEMLGHVCDVARAARDHDLELVVGGGVGHASIDTLRAVRAIRLDRFETRKVVFDGAVLDGDDAATGLALAMRFELLWLKNKREHYRAISVEDEQRIAMLEARKLSGAPPVAA